MVPIITCKLVNYKPVSASVTYKIDHLVNNFIICLKLDCLTTKSIDKKVFFSLQVSMEWLAPFYPIYLSAATIQEINSIKSPLQTKLQWLTLMPPSSISNDRFFKH